MRNVQADLCVQVQATEGRLLSEELQDSRSFRYGMLSVDRRDRQEIAQVIDSRRVLAALAFTDEAR